jgi:hypothetical protein
VRGACSLVDRVYQLDTVRYFIVYRIEAEKERIVVTVRARSAADLR